MSHPIIGRDYTRHDRCHRTCFEAFGSAFPPPAARDPDTPVAWAMAVVVAGLVAMYFVGWLA